MSDAARDVCAARGNLTVGHGQHRVWARFAAAALGYDRNIPETVIGRLREGGCRGYAAGDSQSKKSRANANWAHESEPQMWVMGTLFGPNVSKICCAAISP